MSPTVTHAIIGTAGHIDRGKTALIKALTGQDTDRLKEEKERGISIDLGFAYFTLPDETRAGIVDVPGHERFIRNMLAGAHGIDLVLFTVAADDGVMPQSEEHLDILHLLGVTSGIFVITKADLADAPRLGEVRDEIELLADGPRLAGDVEDEGGGVVADDGLELTTAGLDARLEIRPAAKRPLKNNDRLRLFLGTAETIGRAIVLEAPGEIAPKKNALVQLVLNEPMVALAGDRFVIRDETSRPTLGGCGGLNPPRRRGRKPLEAYLKHLGALEGALAPATVAALIDLQERFAVTAPRVAQLLNAPAREADEALKDRRFVKLSLGDEEGYTTAGKWEELKRFAMAALAAHHQAEPLSPGLEMEALRERLPYEVSTRAFRALVDRLARESDLVRAESVLRLKSHRVKLGRDDGRLRHP